MESDNSRAWSSQVADLSREQRDDVLFQICAMSDGTCADMMRARDYLDSPKMARIMYTGAQVERARVLVEDALARFGLEHRWRDCFGSCQGDRLDRTGAAVDRCQTAGGSGGDVRIETIVIGGTK